MKTLSPLRFWRVSKSIAAFSALLFAFTHSASAVIRDGGIDPANLGKGEWIYSVKDATNRLGGHINSVTNEVSLFKYYKNIGVRYVIIKMGTGSTNYGGCYASPHQVTVNLCNIARTNGVWVFGYTRSYGSNLAGESALVDSVFNNGADGFVFDAEAEWESSQPWIGTNGPALAWQLGQMVRSNWPTKFIAHAPFPIIYFHSSFPYREFGYWCDAVMPQVYHLSTAGLKGSPSATMNWMDVNFRTWQNSLAGTSSVIGGQTIFWTNSIKPIVPVQDVYGEPGNAVGRCNGTTIAYPDKDVTEFIDFAAANPTAATAGGYKGVNFWRADLHGTNQFANIAAGTSGNFSNIVSNIVMDDAAATRVGTWTAVRVFSSTTTTPTYHGATGSDTNSFGTNYWVKAKGTGAAYVQFAPNIVVPGEYNVYQWHVKRADAATNVPFVINHSGGTTTVFANQQTNDGNWTLLGKFNFAAGTSGNIRVSDNFSNASHVAVADGIKLVFSPSAIPAAPSGLSATAVSSSEINLAWTDNSSNETGFVISRATVSGGPYTDIATVGANVTSYNNTGLAPSTTYYYVVGATNNLGASADSNQASATTQFGVSDIIIDNPSASVVGSWSTGTSATDKFGADYRFKSQGIGAAYLQYTPNITTAGDYEVYAWHPQGGNRTLGAPHVINFNGSATTVFVNQQVNGGQWNLLGTYNFVGGTSGNVRITDGFADAGQVVMADAIKFVFVSSGPSIPNAPSGLNATAVSSSQINLSWTDNSSDESNFIVKRSTTSGGPYTTIQTLAANTTTFNNSGLSANTTYYYVVCATNSAGASANSAQASATTFPPAPAAPSGLSANTISAGQINLAWTDNSANESAFVVGRSTTSGGPYSDIISLAANTTSYNNTGLSANTTYHYVVRATNSGGSSANSPQASATTLPFPPSAPGGLSATAVSTSQINLSWTDNSPNETSFTVARSTTSGGPYTDIATLAANTTSYSNTNLSMATTYYYVVRASNTGGSSPNSNQASDTTFGAAPNAPSGLNATAIRATRIDLSWTDNSADESNFVVARSTTPGGPYTDIVTLAANTTSYNNNSGLSANTTYYYVVRATNAGGASPDSNEASATTFETDLLIDNKSAIVTGTWSTGTSAVDKYGADYRFIGQGSGASHLQFTPYIASAGTYEVFEWHAQGSNRTTNAPHIITYNGGTQTVFVNQKINGGQWNSLGVFNFASGFTGNIKITDAFADAGQVAMADAIMLVAVTQTTVTFTSVAAQDGWVLESGENSNAGGSISATDATTSALRSGDNNQDRQYKTVVSFNTSSLPDGATIVSATLKLRRGSVTGTNPFNTHGTCFADIKNGGFGGALALATGDFQAAADATQVATMSNAAANGDWSEGSVNATGRGFINKTGNTQFRVYFATDDNDDNGNDYIGWYSGDNGTAGNRPVLEVVYE